MLSIAVFAFLQLGGSDLPAVASPSLDAMPTPGEPDEVKVESQYIKSEGLLELSAVMRSSTDADALWHALQDIGHHSTFMPYLERTHIVSGDEEHRVLYAQIDPPIVSARDYVTLARFRFEPGYYRRDWIVHPDADRLVPPRKGVVRVHHTTGSWELRALQDGGTRMRYRVTIPASSALARFALKVANNRSIPRLFNAVNAHAKSCAPTTVSSSPTR